MSGWEFENTLTVGLDIGYGAVKAVTPGASLVFPSVWGHARDIRYQQDGLAARYPGDQVRDDEGTWFVGDLAMAQLPPGEVFRLRGRAIDANGLGSTSRVRLMKALCRIANSQMRSQRLG